MILACIIVGYFATHHAYWYQGPTKELSGQKEVGNMFANCLRDIDSVTCSNSKKAGIEVEGTNFVRASLESDAIISLRLQTAALFLTFGYETMMLIAAGVYFIADLSFANTPNHASLVCITGAFTIGSGVFLLASGVCFVLAIGKLG